MGVKQVAIVATERSDYDQPDCVQTLPLVGEPSMNDSYSTRPSLLIRIRDAQNHVAWEEFAHLYTPLIYRFLMKYALQDADASDLTQEVLRRVAGAIGRLDYDPERGSFRGWLLTITRNTLNTFLDRRRRQAQGSGDTGMIDILEKESATDDEVAEYWEQEYEKRMFDWAAEQVRASFKESTWQAFWQTAVEGKGAQQVGEAVGLSVGAVYIAKSRVLAKLKEKIEAIGDR